MELLVVDDGSQDGTWAVLQSLRSKCESQLERVEFIRQENTGICGALNRLSKMAKGEFVAIIASDDEYLPGAFSAMMPEFENSDVGIVVGQNEIMDGEGRRCFWNRRLQNVYSEHEAVYRTWNQYLVALTGVAENGPDYGSYRKLVECNHVVNGYLIRRSHWDRILPYRQEAPTEDLWFHMQFSKFAKYRAVSKSTFRYRWHDGNFSRQSLRAIRSRYLTMRWEQGNVRGSLDRRWQVLFEQATASDEILFRIPGVVTLKVERNLEEKRKILAIFGLPFLLKRKSQTGGLV